MICLLCRFIQYRSLLLNWLKAIYMSETPPSLLLPLDGPKWKWKVSIQQQLTKLFLNIFVTLFKIQKTKTKILAYCNVSSILCFNKTWVNFLGPWSYVSKGAGSPPSPHSPFRNCAKMAGAYRCNMSLYFVNFVEYMLCLYRLYRLHVSVYCTVNFRCNIISPSFGSVEPF